MSIIEDRELKKQDESELASMKNKGVVINRGTLRLSIGGIYKKQDSDEEYQLFEFVDANQAFFKNLKTLKVQVLSIHQFENVHDADHTVMRLDIDAISDKEWERAQAKHAAICQPCAQKYTHKTCPCCKRYRKLIQTEAGEMCQKCHDLGQISCAGCQKPIWAGRGQRCHECYLRERLIEPGFQKSPQAKRKEVEKKLLALMNSPNKLSKAEQMEWFILGMQFFHKKEITKKALKACSHY